jgi:hypothetical protein
MLSLAAMADTKAHTHQLNGTKLGGSLYNPYNGKVGQRGISYRGVTYLNLYRLQNIIREVVLKAQIFALRVNLIVMPATGISKQRCR